MKLKVIILSLFFSTGLGPSNPLKLDNLDDKVLKLNTTGAMDDKLVILLTCYKTLLFTLKK